jgi:hypothetical protein
MTASLRALLAKSIDYAGMFPPASLPLIQALEQFRGYRNDPASWMLSRFVVPAGKLAELAAIYEPKRDAKLTVVVPAAADHAGFVKNLNDVLSLVQKFPERDAIDMLEFRWPAAVARGSDEPAFRGAVQAVADRNLHPAMSFFFELPASETPLPHEKRARRIRAAVSALADGTHAHFKLRCGGAKAGDIPSSAEVALAIHACRERKADWKATAGLHHPFRHVDAALGVLMHGFLNVLCATVLDHFHHLDEHQTQAIIEEADPREFQFSDESLSWREYAVDAKRLAEAGARRLLSFGSCSFEEPCQDLKELGLL